MWTDIGPKRFLNTAIVVNQRDETCLDSTIRTLVSEEMAQPPRCLLGWVSILGYCAIYYQPISTHYKQPSNAGLL